MRMFLLSTAAALALPQAALGQSMGGMQMPGMAMPAPKTAAKAPAPAHKKKHPAEKKRATQKSSPAPAHEHQPANAMPGMDMSADHPDHGAHDMSAMPEMQSMPGMKGMAPAPSGTDLPAGNALPPPIQHDRSADRFYGAAAMAEAEQRMMNAHGGAIYRNLLVNLAEYQARRGRDGYRWDGEAWIGGDLNRLVLKSEGEGSFKEAVGNADIQALYSRAIDPYWNIQAGIRQSFQPGPDRPYAVLSVEGLAPYWLEAEASLFLSSKGDLLARAETYYDQRITQRLVLQPRAELNFSAQDVRENQIGSGLSSAELGLRLRYEIRREFAPYIGFSWERSVGDTARFARAAGDDVQSRNFVMGLRFWF